MIFVMFSGAIIGTILLYVLLIVIGALWAGFLAGAKHKTNKEESDEMVKESWKENL